MAMESCIIIEFYYFPIINEFDRKNYLMKVKFNNQQGDNEGAGAIGPV